MLISVLLARLFALIDRLGRMALGSLGMMGAGLVFVLVISLRSIAVTFGSILMVRCRVCMMLAGWMVRHFLFSLIVGFCREKRHHRNATVRGRIRKCFMK
jgi:hypothetical protein